MAIAQSRQVARMITERTGRPVEIVKVTTLGDVSQAQLTQIGGTGVFVSALREALLAGEVDLAVHSLKDLPTGPAAGIVQADCSAPIGAYAAWPAGGSGVVPPSKHGQLWMRAAVMSTDGRRILRAYGTAAAADTRRLGRDLAEELLGQSRGPG